MPIVDLETKRRTNNLGVLRLALAALVVVSHAPEIVDGNRSRELLSRAFGTLSLGVLAVDGFFLISGYLIAQSFDRSVTATSYLLKRVGRIVPGYLLAFCLCFFVLAPSVGGDLGPTVSGAVAQAFEQISWLLRPDVTGAFSQVAYSTLDGSMWTIAYEFRCYIGVLLLGTACRRVPLPMGILALGSLVLACFAITALRMVTQYRLPIEVEHVIGQVGPTIRFTGVFGTGVLFYLLKDRLPWNNRTVVGAAILLGFGLSRWKSAEISFAVFGGYLILWSAFHLPQWRFGRWTDEADLSYGLYLYAWPIMCCLVYSVPNINPWLLCFVTIPASLLCGLLSWTLVERRSIGFVHRLAGKVDRRHRQRARLIAA